MPAASFLLVVRRGRCCLVINFYLSITGIFWNQQIGQMLQWTYLVTFECDKDDQLPFILQLIFLGLVLLISEDALVMKISQLLQFRLL